MLVADGGDMVAVAGLAVGGVIMHTPYLKCKFPMQLTKHANCIAYIKCEYNAQTFKNGISNRFFSFLYFSFLRINFR